MSKEYTNAEILAFLHNNPVMSISAYDGQKPISSVLLFYVDEHFNFYFVTRKNTFKAKALLKYPQVSFSIWKYKEMFVQVDGEAIVLDTQDYLYVLDQIASAAGRVPDFWPPILAIPDNDYIIFKIVPTWLRVMDISGLNVSEATPPYQEIINTYAK